MMASTGYTDVTLYRRLLRQARPYWPYIGGIFLLASIVLLVAPAPTTAVAAGVSVLLFLLADLFRLDSRREQDVIRRPE